MRRGRHGDGRRCARALRRRAPARLDGRLRKAGYARQRGEEWSRALAVPLAGEGAALAVLAPALLVLLGVDAADYVAPARGRGVRRRRGGARALRRAPRGAPHALRAAAVLTKQSPFG